jgi:hypothetical protein
LKIKEKEYVKRSLLSTVIHVCMICLLTKLMACRMKKGKMTYKVMHATGKGIQCKYGRECIIVSFLSNA